MPKSTDSANAILALLCRAETWNGIAENDSTSPNTNLYVALHTDAIAVGDDQTVNEATYTGYARIPIARSSVGWETPASGSTSNKLLAQFDPCTALTNTVKWVSIGLAASPSASTVIWAGQLTADRTISAGIQPQFAANALVITES